MNSTGISTILAFLLVLAVAGAALRFFQVRRTYYIGISLWSRWLPVVATGIYLGTLAMNLAADGRIDPGPLSFTGFFSTAEVIVLFLAGPLFLTRLGNIFGALTLAYCIERLLGSPGTAAIGSQPCT